MKETGNFSKSQYSGTTKNSVCTICNKSVNHLTRLQQDKHVEDHMKDARTQTGLDDF